MRRFHSMAFKILDNAYDNLVNRKLDCYDIFCFLANYGFLLRSNVGKELLGWPFSGKEPSTPLALFLQSNAVDLFDELFLKHKVVQFLSVDLDWDKIFRDLIGPDADDFSRKFNSGWLLQIIDMNQLVLAMGIMIINHISTEAENVIRLGCLAELSWYIKKSLKALEQYVEYMDGAAEYVDEVYSTLRPDIMDMVGLNLTIGPISMLAKRQLVAQS
jgi:hypothetical protein